MTYKIIQGDNRLTLKTLEDNSIDAIVTDPPYGINFLGKTWDADTGSLETYKECLRVLKPGGHILAFSAARTYHYLAITLEQAGFEIRDQIMWIYSSGFPKSQDIGRQIQKKLGVKEKRSHKNNIPRIGGDVDISIKDNGQTVCTDPQAKAWEGWGTSLKPAQEPICLARKPLKQSIAANVQQYGTGALNIDATRIERENESPRFPSNVIGELGDYQKFFYCPKVSRKERHIGHKMPAAMFGNMKGAYDANGQRYAVELDKRIDNTGNTHPTVKPVELMKYLIKLITPKGGTVLDPFNGSGSTGMAAVELGFDYIGCELDPEYVKISEARIAAWTSDLVIPAENNFDDLFDQEDDK